MPTSPYFLADGSPAPGVTTVIGGNLAWSKGALMFWAWKQGKAGLDFRQTTKDAADAGTLAHAMVEAYWHDRTFTPPADTPPEMLGKAERSFGAFREWVEDTRLTVLATEAKMVSERHRFGGTPDWIARRGNGRLCLPDVKTSAGTYADNVIQVVAYVELWEETFPNLPMEGGAYILRFDKTTGGFSTKWIPRDAMVGPWQAFLALRQLYDLKKGVEALAK